MLVHTWQELNENIKGSMGREVKGRNRKWRGREGEGKKAGRGREKGGARRLKYLIPFTLHQTQSGRNYQPHFRHEGLRNLPKVVLLLRSKD